MIGTDHGPPIPGPLKMGAFSCSISMGSDTQRVVGTTPSAPALWAIPATAMVSQQSTGSLGKTGRLVASLVAFIGISRYFSWSSIMNRPGSVAGLTAVCNSIASTPASVMALASAFHISSSVRLLPHQPILPIMAQS